MKGGLYITILFGALLCDAAVSVETRPSKNVAKSGKLKNILYDENELSSEVNTISRNRNVIQVDEINSTLDVTGINENKSSNEVSAEIEENSHSENKYDIQNKSNNINSEKNDSAEDYNDEYKKIYATEFTDTVINNGVPSKEEVRGKLNKFSREKEPQEIFSSDEEMSGIHHELHASPQGATSSVGRLKANMFSTVNHYFCNADKINESQQILYGTKSWTFPVQNVNLTLSYPMTQPTSPSSLDPAEEVNFIITGFKVILFIDGVQTRGYITSGGILQEKISLTFINSGITSLLYKFWLYGIPRHNTTITELNLMHYMCN